MTDIDLAAIRARLAASTGRTYWRSLEELADTAEFQEYLHTEFPSQASEFTDPVGRRQFLRLMGASLALAGVGACTKQPREEIVPYVQAPEYLIPGRPLFFATAMPLDGYGTGLLVETHMGRPTKIEGNPDHPASLGGTDAMAQASVLTLYDPDRSQTLLYLDEVRTWGDFLGAMQSSIAGLRPRQGAGLHLLTGTLTSPALGDQIRTLLEDLPGAKWHQYDPAGRDMARAGARLAFGEAVDTQLDIEAADVIVSIDADFLTRGPGAVRYARQFGARRRVEGETSPLNRLYIVESTPTPTGTVADHRMALAPGQVAAFAAALASALGVPQAGGIVGANLPERARTWVPALVQDLQAHRGRSLIIAGEEQPPAVQALVHAMNVTLGNVGTTVRHTAPVEVEPRDQHASLADLANDLAANRVELLVIFDVNVAYCGPADLRLADRLRESKAVRVHVGLHRDETAELCQWHVPGAHFLETWGDVRAFDGTATICQPLIAPLYDGRSAYEVLAVMSPRPDRTGYDIVRAFWQRTFAAADGTFGPLADATGQPFADFEAFWKRSLHDGVVAGSALPTRAVTVTAGPFTVGSPASGDGYEVIFRPDPSVYDGQFANNGWLQELPKALTKLTWENVALVSPRTAEALGLQSGMVAEVTHGGLSVRAPVSVMPGHADGSVTLPLGYGRTRAGRVGNGLGFDAYAVRTTAAPWTARGGAIVPSGERVVLAASQLHHTMEGRHLVRTGTIAEYQAHPEFVRELGHDPDRALTLLPEYKYEGNAWGLTIDLNTCTGCNACVVACQSENNIPVVGKEQVIAGREMHWIRVDRYYEGDLDDPNTYHQPVPCMHCENAPCEVVCPVAATSHSSEGLNDMVYNRCIGTRYCSNNCPYKVRRFNFLLYQDFSTPVLKLARNPDVTVRSRGVMEKCTYCVQRINGARIDAEREGRPIRDGEIVTACQQVCPTQAITFGNINDPSSRVAALKASPRNYGVLTDLNTRPRTTYLAVIRNPNPELEGAAPHAAATEH